MRERIRTRIPGYPRQFWIIVLGGLISSSGGSMVWPFLFLYVRDRLGVPLAEVGVVLGLSSIATLISQPLAGSLVDRFGRRTAMLVSLGGGTLTTLGLIFASSLQEYFVLAIFGGAVWPVGSVATQAMVADLIPPEDRPRGFAILRIGHNVGFSLGPFVGGFLAARSFAYSFGAAAAASFIVLLLFAATVSETMPLGASATPTEPASSGGKPSRGGYGRILRDLPYMSFAVGYALLSIAYMPMLSLLAVTLKEVHGISESGFGALAGLNGAMVVLFQLPVTRITDRFARLPVMAVGAVLVAVGSGSVAYLSVMPMFAAAMAVFTLGELVFVPTAQSVAADLAPADMRGRYMAILGLSWGLSRAVGSPAAGAMNDVWGPAALWQGTFVMGLASAAVFLFLWVRSTRVVEAPGIAAVGE